jgi:fibro-slime domain-containing protein
VYEEQVVVFERGRVAVPRQYRVLMGLVRTRVYLGAAAMALGLPMAGGCGGGRTALLPAETLSGPCTTADLVHTCSNTCGEGEQICRDGVWQACVIPTVSRDCSNACGTGEQICRDGTWGACSVPVVRRSCSTICGSGTQVCQTGVWTDCDAPRPGRPKLLTTLRDFHSTHPDMESPGLGDRSELGLVKPLLGEDDTPVYARPGGTGTVTGPETFAQWYHDVPGVNVTVPYEIPLQASSSRADIYEFNGVDFFPLDARGFGNEGEQHNFDFTLATHFTFRYQGGEMFRFTGDDDLWVFINRHLAIDLGGLHQMKTGEVYLDERAAEFGITPGDTYQLHLFFAERHVKDSDFIVETSIADPGACGP